MIFIHICSRARALMYRLYCFRRSTNLRLRKHLIQMFLFPLVDYCCVVYNNLLDELNAKLQRLVNSGIRYIYGFKRWEHVTLCSRELCWFKTKARRKYFAANLFRKTFNTATPSPLLALFCFVVVARPVRSDMKPLVIHGFATVTLRKSFHISSACLEFITITYAISPLFLISNPVKSSGQQTVTSYFELAPR